MNNRKSSRLLLALVFGLGIVEGHASRKPVGKAIELAPESRSSMNRCQVVDYGQFDPKRVNEFLHVYLRPTAPQYSFLGSSLERRAQELDNRIRRAALSLVDKIEVFRRLSPRQDESDEPRELRMERLILSIAPKELALFKLALEYDGDYKDLEEYIFHDIDIKEYRNRIIEHFGKAPRQIGIKVLSDVDDTMYANLVDPRYPKKTLYPGVLEFYDSLKDEPFALTATPVTTLSARRNPVAGVLEEASLRALISLPGELCPSALSGDVVSSTIDTHETVLRNKLDDPLHDDIPPGQEDEIGEVKFRNFLKFSEVYPEYRYVFVGDSGQADALTAQRMVAKGLTGGTTRVVTTFIHYLTKVSSSFKKLPSELVVKKTSASGRGVIVFRNYIDAAVIALMHSKTLENLITPDDLGKITKAALTQFNAITFPVHDAAAVRLRREYRQDAEEAYKLLTTGSSKPSSDVIEIRRILDRRF